MIDTSPHQIEIGIVVPAIIYAPVWLADQRGFLRDEGLTVRLRSFGPTDATTAALRDGVVPVTIGSPEGSIANALNGGDLRLVSGFVSRPPLSMIAQPRYHSMAELRGAKLGTTSLKEGTCHLMEKMMAAHGMHKPADFQFVMAGAHPERWEALKAGTLDAALGGLNDRICILAIGFAKTCCLLPNAFSCELPLRAI
jgi:ABC-type nitrate/sulfonate/bicarbonate transport system substrate-binding protein